MGATPVGTPGLRSGIDLPGLGLVVFVVLLVVVGLILGRRSKPGPSDPNSGDDGWGKGPPPPGSPRPDNPPGGMPLDDAVPAGVRLRGRGRLAEKLPARPRRPAREPARAPDRERSASERSASRAP